MYNLKMAIVSGRNIKLCLM